MGCGSGTVQPQYSGPRRSHWHFLFHACSLPASVCSEWRRQQRVGGGGGRRQLGRAVTACSQHRPAAQQRTEGAATGALQSGRQVQTCRHESLRSLCSRSPLSLPFVHYRC